MGPFHEQPFNIINNIRFRNTQENTTSTKQPQRISQNIQEDIGNIGTKRQTGNLYNADVDIYNEFIAKVMLNK